MWSDNETTRDFLNFRHVASIVAELIGRADGKPLSIGVSGGWGVGKSSMVQLIGESVRLRGEDKFLVVPFNAWLYQGYDDARAALMETILRALQKHAKANESVLKKLKNLAERIDWLRAAGLTASSAAAIALGLPPIGLIGEAVQTFGALTDGAIDQNDLAGATSVGKKVAAKSGSLVKPQKVQPTPPAAIEELRSQFRDTLKELNVTLVVLIDDLDRCLPQTTISTLEAIRLFLFLDRTAFVIAADERMIRHAVQVHFGGMPLDDQLITSYFDKLIQVPIRVPPLGTQDVRAYLMLLFIDNSDLGEEQKEDLRIKICSQLGLSWQGMRVDRPFVAGLIPDCPPKLAEQLDLADRLAPLLTTATQIAGNPRLIKRFLNTVEIRLSIARDNGVTVDEAVLAKLHLLERCGDRETYARVVAAINESDEGSPSFFADLEETLAANPKAEGVPAEWASQFGREWIRLKPSFAGKNLRSAVYASREHLPIITSGDTISPAGLSLLKGLLAATTLSPAVVEPLRALAQGETALIMDRLLEQARSFQSWGTPGILFACLTLADADPAQGVRLANFLERLPPSQLTAALIPLISAKPWAQDALGRIAKNPATPQPVKTAIATKDQ